MPTSSGDHRADKLTGELAGDISSMLRTKRAVLENAVVMPKGIDMQLALTVGDGANDHADDCGGGCKGNGLGVGYHPRPQLAAAANFSVRYNDLTALLYAQGCPTASEWAGLKNAKQIEPGYRYRYSPPVRRLSFQESV